MIRRFLSKFVSGTGSDRRSLRVRQQGRRLSIEALESRQLLSITLPTIAGQTVLAGAPLNLALNGLSSAGNPVNYTVSVANSTLTNSAQLTTTIPTGNPSLRIVADDAVDNIHGTMVLQLFKDLAPETVAKIKGLADEGFYNGLTFHRILANFMIQGGDPDGTGSGGPGFQFDSEINSSLQFTSSGLLAMANSGPDTNGSQFFITDTATRWLDFRYTIFGLLTQGDATRDALNSVPGSETTSGTPTNTVKMTTVTTFTDTQNGVLRLSAPSGTTGGAEVTVTATDSVTHETTSRTFQVTVSADTNISQPFLGPIAPIQTSVNTPTAFTIPVVDIDNNTKTFTAVVQPANSNLTVSVNATTGQVTVTPANGVTGVFGVKVGVNKATPSSTDTADTQVVPVYVSPSAPTSVTLMSTSDTGDSTDKLTNLNNTPGKPLQFQVNGVVSGTTVELFADGVSIGSATASGTTVVVTTNGSATLADGTRSITAKQSLKNQAVAVGNLTTTTDLVSAASAATTITVDATAPVLTAAHPSLGSTLQTAAKTISLTGTFINNGTGTTTIITDANAGGIALIGMTGLGTWAYSTDGTTFTNIESLSPGSALLLAKTAQLKYTPNGTESETPTITYRAWDTTTGTNGARADLSVSSTFGDRTSFSAVTDTASLIVNDAPVLTPAGPTGTIHKNTPVTVTLATFFDSDVLASISDANLNSVGGIAVVGVTGGGAWAYSLDGVTFQTMTSVSASSALLLPATVKIRFTPNGQAGEATIAFRAWDTTTGAVAGRADLSATSATGGTTAFSTDTDTATVTVDDVTDSTVLTQADPSMGSTTGGTAKIISLTGTFINNGTGTTTITATNSGAVAGGIALIDTTGAGAWQFSIDNGTTFEDLPLVGDDSALLLNKNAKLKYTPADTNDEVATITYRAWDATTASGTNGTQVDLTGAVGDTTGFSLFTDAASLTVNNAPVILTPASPVMGSNTEDAAATTVNLAAIINNGDGSTVITDVGDNPTLGGIALVGAVGHGTWEYSHDGVTFQSIGTVSAASALLLSADADLRYTPDGQNAETATITYRAWDTTSGTPGGRVDLSATTAVGGATAFSQTTDTASFSVTSVNDAPVLNPKTPSMGGTGVATAKIINLTGTFINNGTSTTNIGDVDTGNVTGGIAVTGIAGNGTWAYSTDGTTYQAISPVSEASALLLNKNASLRYTPTGTGGETASVTYRAWDTTSGANGGRVPLSAAGAVGGTTAYSLASDTALLTVSSTANVNNAPNLTPASPNLGSTAVGVVKTISLTGTFINNGAGTSVIADADSGDVKGGIALTATTGAGVWAYSLDGTTFFAVGTVAGNSALLLPTTASLRYTPDASTNESATITYRAWDTTTGTSGNKFDTTTNGGTTAFSAQTDTASLAVGTVATSGSLSGFVYVDSNNDGLRTTSTGGTHVGLGGVTVRLFLQGTGGTWTEVAGKSPVQTHSDGSYSFTNLAAGTYQVRETQPLELVDGKDTAGTVGTATKGTVGEDQVQVDLGAGEIGSGYNFGERGLQSSLMSLRMFLASTPPLPQVIQSVHTAPTVDLSATAAGNSNTATFSTDTSGVAIAAADASIVSPGSPTIASLTATIGNRLDGSYEKLEVDASGTNLTSSYTNGVLTLSGVADLAAYQTLLRNIKYSDIAASPQAGARTVTVTVNDGSASSKTATSTVTVVVVPATIALSNSSVAENSASGTVVGDLSTTSSGTTGTRTYSLVTGSGSDDNASFTISGSQLKTGAAFNFESKGSYKVRVRSTAANNSFTEQTFTITVTNVNETPTAIALSNSSVAENQAAVTVVGQLSTTDPDSGATFTYSLVSGTGSTDNASFTIDGNQLKTNASFDFETKSSYSVLVRSIDQGGLFTEQAFTITVTNVNEGPAAVILSSSSVAENQAVGTVVGQLSTTDPDAGGTFTYSLVNGTGSTDNGSFTISGNQLKTNAAFDFETKSSYSILVRSTDQGGLTKDQTFTITVTNANDAPTAVALTSSTVAENVAVGTVVGQLSSTDPDSGNTFTYSLVTGTGSTDNGLFTIDGNQLKTNAAMDFEAKPSCSILVRSTDQGGLTKDQVFTITVTNVNEAPTAITLSNSTVAENETALTVVGLLGTTDPDVGNSFTYSLATGAGDTGNGSFMIVGNQLATGASFNFETNPTYSIRVRSTDAGGLFTEQIFTITVTNVNEAPTAVTLSNSTVQENQAIGTVVGQLGTTDPDAAGTHTYTLVTGTGDTNNGSFTIVDNQLKTNASFDFETKASYTIRVRSTDQGGLSTEQALTITVTDVNEAPTAIALSSSTVAENQAVGTVVGQLSSTDPDPANTFTYSLVTGTGDADNGSFTIANNELKTNAVFNFEANASYSILVRSTDQGGLTKDQAFTITVTNVNEAPTAIALSATAVPENQPIGTVVGQLSTTDPDTGGSFTYALVAGTGGDDNASFTIDGSQLKTNASFDFETKTSCTIRVKSTDQGALSTEQVFTINVTDVANLPILSPTSVRTDKPVGTVVGTLGMGDPPADAIYIYSLVAGTGGDDNASFAIDGNQLKTNAVFDISLKDSYTIRVQGIDQGNVSTVQVFTITVIDPNEAPTALALSATSAAENQAAGAVVGQFTTTDANTRDTFTYALVAGTGSDDNASFAIDGNQLKTGASFDFEAKPSYKIRVRTTDNRGLWTEQAFTINVTNVNETPTAVTLTGNSVDENLAAGTVVGQLGTTDPDAGNTFIYTLVGGTGSDNNASFAIDGNQLKTGASFDFETKASYTVRVRSTDQGGLWTEQAFTITVTNVNDAPTAIALSGNTVVENLAAGTVVGQLSTTDQDTGNTFTYSLVTGTGGDDNSSFTIANNQLKTNASFNFEAKSSYTVRVRSTDSGGLWTERAFTITVTGVNEAPAAIVLSNTTVAGAQPIGTAVGLLATADQDAGNTFAYTLVTGTGSDDNSSFTVTGNELKTGVVLSSVARTYAIRVRSVDQGGLAVEQTLVITVGEVNQPLTDIALSNDDVTPNQPAGTTVGQLSTTGPALGATQIYSLVPGTGSGDNASFTIDGSTLKTSGPLTAGSESVRVRSSTFFLASDVVDVTGTGGAYVVQLNYDPAELPTGLESSLVNGGSVSLASDRLGGWSNAAAANDGAAGNLAQTKVLGSWADFIASVRSANPTVNVTEANVLGSWGIDTTNHTVWAVVDYSSGFAVEVGVFTERTFTVTVAA